jgi:hypothetical protein
MDELLLMDPINHIHVIGNIDQSMIMDDFNDNMNEIEFPK